MRKDRDAAWGRRRRTSEEEELPLQPQAARAPLPLGLGRQPPQGACFLQILGGQCHQHASLLGLATLVPLLRGSDETNVCATALPVPDT